MVTTQGGPSSLGSTQKCPGVVRDAWTLACGPTLEQAEVASGTVWPLRPKAFTWQVVRFDHVVVSAAGPSFPLWVELPRAGLWHRVRPLTTQ